MRYHGQKEVIVMTYTACTLCPRRCGVNRAAGQLGFCRQGAQLRAARAAAHFWEEPCISGHWGSGAVFFSGCTLRCVYCQNHSISSGGAGQPLTAGQLRRVFEQLIDQGVHNINLVTPTQFLPDILPALEPKLPVPVIMNSGGYESVPTLRALEGLVDIYLPDFKYADPALGARLSSAGDYPAAALAAIREMARQTGPAQYDDDGMLLSGTLVRHLVLPGCVDNSLRGRDSGYSGQPAAAVCPAGGADAAHTAGPPRHRRRIRRGAQLGRAVRHTRGLYPGSRFGRRQLYPRFRRHGTGLFHVKHHRRILLGQRFT